MLRKCQLGYWIRTFVKPLHWLKGRGKFELLFLKTWVVGARTNIPSNVGLACRKSNYSKNSAWVRTWSFFCCCFTWQFFISTLGKVATGAIRKRFVTQEMTSWPETYLAELMRQWHFFSPIFQSITCQWLLKETWPYHGMPACTECCKILGSPNKWKSQTICVR